MRRLPGFWRLTEDAAGYRPDAVKRAIMALIPQAGAETEGQLRPIGLLSYIYRVWIAVRKQDLRQWSLALHGGAYDLLRIAASIEGAQWQGKSALVAFLDCSKC